MLERRVEIVFQHLKVIVTKWLKIPIIEQVNSIFGLPKMYDDLLDEWTHENHINERNSALQRFQDFAEKNKIRITFFSSDVHGCGVSRFRTQTTNPLIPIKDPKLMYQIISSAIVNKPRRRQFIQTAHLFRTKWYPVNNTEEQLIDYFEREPGDGSLLFLKKLLPNRNWCYFEQCEEITSTVTIIPEKSFLEILWLRILLLLSFLGLDRLFGWSNEPHDCLPGETYHQNIITCEDQQEANNIKIRFWVESIGKKGKSSTFSSYDLFIPNLKR